MKKHYWSVIQKLRHNLSDYCWRKLREAKATGKAARSWWTIANIFD